MRIGLLWLCFLAQSIHGQTLWSLVQQVANAPALQTGQVGVCVREASTGNIILEYNAKKTFKPASTQKVVTTMAGLSLLGDTATFATRIGYYGTVSGGVLKGMLVIQGGGDPTLASPYFPGSLKGSDLAQKWAEQLKSLGITRIDGDVVGDVGLFEETVLPSPWLWEDMGNYYASGAWGLNWGENEYKLFFQPGAKAGEPTSILRTEPHMPDLIWTNQVLTGAHGSGDNAFIYGAPYSYTRYVVGTIPAGPKEFSIKGSLPDPPLFAAEELLAALKAAGITVTGEATTMRHIRLEHTPPGGSFQQLFLHRSASLGDIVYWCNKRSNNLYAECILKFIGARKSGKGTTMAGIEWVRNYWSGKGVATAGWFMRDGSGLSPTNGITPAQLTDMMYRFRSNPKFPVFLKSLPVCGLGTDDGNNKNVCDGTSAAGRICAKGGYIARVRTYTGYAQTKAGPILVFTVMLNEYTCPPGEALTYIEKILLKLVEG